MGEVSAACDSSATMVEVVTSRHSAWGGSCWEQVRKEWLARATPPRLVRTCCCAESRQSQAGHGMCHRGYALAQLASAKSSCPMLLRLTTATTGGQQHLSQRLCARCTRLCKVIVP
jgi:hypothetical protein